MNIWIYESMNLWIYESMNIWIYEYMDRESKLGTYIKIMDLYWIK
jgi:hypothetical protein